jgi:hypothetical protein
MNTLKERVQMKSLKELRNQRKKTDLLYTGEIESLNVTLPEEVIKEQRDYFESIIKPISQRVFSRYISNN